MLKLLRSGIKTTFWQNLCILNCIKDRDVTIKLLEDKLKQNEADALKNFKITEEQVKVHKSVNKNHASEMSKELWFVFVYPLYQVVSILTAQMGANLFCGLFMSME